MVDLRKAWKNLREGTSKGLEPTSNAIPPIIPPVPVIPSEIPAPIPTEVTLPSPPTPPEETPEEKLNIQLASMDSDTIIAKVLGVPRLPGEAMVLSKLLSDDRFLKWLKIHVPK